MATRGVSATADNRNNSNFDHLVETIDPLVFDMDIICDLIIQTDGGSAQEMWLIDRLIKTVRTLGAAYKAATHESSVVPFNK